MLSGLVVAALWSASPAEAAFPGKNGLISYAAPGKIYGIRANGTGGGLLVGRIPGAWEHSWSARGDQLLVRSSGTLTLLETRGFTSRPVAMPDLPGPPDSPDYSAGVPWESPALGPDGRRFAVQYNPDDNLRSQQVLVVSLEDASYKRIAGGGAEDPEWDPKGRFVAYSAFGKRCGAIKAAAPDGSGKRTLFEPKPEKGFCRYSPAGFDIAPNGKSLVFVGVSGRTTGDEYLYDVFTLKLGATTPKRLTRTGDVESVAWSPDGRLIAFGRFDGLKDIEGIWTVPVTGGKSRLVKRDDEGNGPLEWQPKP